MESTDVPTLTIGARPIPLSRVWVHLQDPWRLPPEPFVLFVPKSRTVEIFDPHHRCPSDVPLDAFVANDIADLGTFILEGFMKRVREAGKSNRGPFEWVIATVDRVEANEKGMSLIGQAIPWAPEAYAVRRKRNWFKFW